MKKVIFPTGVALGFLGIFFGFQNCGNDAAVKKKVSEQSKEISTTNLRIEDLNSIMYGLVEQERNERIRADERLSLEIDAIKSRLDLQESKLITSISEIENKIIDLKGQDSLLADRASSLETSVKNLEESFNVKLVSSESSLRESIRARDNELWEKLLSLDTELSALRGTANLNSQEIISQRNKLLEVIQAQKVFENYANENYATKMELFAQQQLYNALENVTKSLDLRITRTSSEIENILGPRVLDLSSRIQSLEYRVSSQGKDIEVLRSDLNSAVVDYRKQHQELVDLLRNEMERFAENLGTMMIHKDNALRQEILLEINKKALELTLYTNKSVSLISDSIVVLNQKVDSTNSAQIAMINEIKNQMVLAIAHEQEQRNRISIDLSLLTEKVVRLENEISDLRLMTDLNAKLIDRLSTDFEMEKESVSKRFSVQKEEIDKKVAELRNDLTQKLNDLASHAENLVKNLGSEVQDNFKNISLEVATLKMRQSNAETQLQHFIEEYQTDRSKTLTFSKNISGPFREAQTKLATLIDSLSALQLQFIQVLNPDENSPDFYNDDLRKYLNRLNKKCGSLEDTAFANVLGMDSFQILSIEFTRLLLSGLKSGDSKRDQMFHSFGALAGAGRLQQSVVVGLVRTPFGDTDNDCKYTIQQWAKSILLSDPRFLPISQALASDDDFLRRIEVLYEGFQYLVKPLDEIQSQIERTVVGVRDSSDAFVSLVNQTALDLINAAWDQRQLADRLATLDGFEKVQTAHENIREEMEEGFSQLREKLQAFEEKTNSRLTRLEEQQGSMSLSLKRALDVLISLADRGGHADLKAYARWAGAPLNYTPVIYPSWRPQVKMVQHFFSGPLSLRNKTDACTGAKILPKGGIQGYYQFGTWGPCWVNFRRFPLPRWGNEFKTLWLRIFGSGHIVNLKVDPGVQKQRHHAFVNYNYNRSFDFRNDLTNPDICLFGTFDNGVFDIKTPDLLDFYLKNIRTWGGVTVSVSTSRSEEIGGEEVSTNSSIFNYTIQVFSPLIVDLHKSGLPRTISSVNSKVKTNLVDSFKIERTGWVEGHEAAFLLKNDLPLGTSIRRNHLFTENETCGEVSTNNAFESLGCLDSDSNKLVNAQDPGFSGLRLFFDFNADGIVNAGEIKRLEEFGIDELPLSFEIIPESQGIRDGNDQRYLSHIKSVDGFTRGKLIDIYFGVERN